MVKKKEELNPQAREVKGTIEVSQLKNVMKDIPTFDFEPNENKEETFYKLAIRELFNEKSIETKTEWLNPTEVFVATKLEFLGSNTDIPLMATFIQSLERKRISLNRKGREEIILSLQQRREEEIEMRKAQLFGGFGNNQM